MRRTSRIDFPFSVSGVRNTMWRWGTRHLPVIYTVQHFLVKFIPRDAVPSNYTVRNWYKRVNEDIHVSTIFQI